MQNFTGLGFLHTIAIFVSITIVFVKLSSASEPRSDRRINVSTKEATTTVKNGWRRIKRENKCSNESPSSRTDCGWSGITGSVCRAMDCCYDSTLGYTKCYIGRGGLLTLNDSCDFNKPFERQDCGYPGITKSQCESRNCCFDNRVVGVNHCFFTKVASAPNSFTDPTTNITSGVILKYLPFALLSLF